MFLLQPAAPCWPNINCLIKTFLLPPKFAPTIRFGFSCLSEIINADCGMFDVATNARAIKVIDLVGFFNKPKLKQSNKDGQNCLWNFGR